MLIVKWHAYNNMYMPTLIDLVTGSSKYTHAYIRIYIHFTVVLIQQQYHLKECVYAHHVKQNTSKIYATSI